MAQRTISTRLAVEGESQYRAAISNVNAELKNMQSALKMTESQYASNANSIEALTAKSTALNNLLGVQKVKVAQVEAGLKNAQAAEAEYAAKKEALTQKINENTQALNELKSSAKDTSEEEQRLREENERLNAELVKNEAYLKGARRAVTNWKTDLNKAKTAVNETKTAINANNDALNQLEDRSKAAAEATNALAATLVASGLKTAIREIAETLLECVDASIAFESAMAGVQKTSNMSGDELSGMGEEIKEIATEIPTTTTEFAKIVETAGQLGIQKENLVRFSKVMAALGVSTNMTSDEAATLLARFANVTRMSPDLYENLGSVIVALGNNFATTEKEIVALGQRLAAAGELAGLTEPEIMALATAMSSVGIEAEAGGTAMTQTLTAMEQAVASGGENLQKFADISGMSAEQFSSAWETAPITAVQSFIKGLGGLEAKGESATLILEEMGLSGVRQSNMLKSLATASGLLGKAVNQANTAWSENKALMTEAETRYSTTESKLQILKNSANNLKIAIGDQLNPEINNLIDTGTNATQWATEFAEANQWLAPAITAVAAALSVLLGYVTTATMVIPLLKKAFAALNASFLASPAGVVALGISMVTAAVVTLAATLPDATKEARELNDAMDVCAEKFSDSQIAFEDNSQTIDATANVIDNYISRLDELESKTTLSAAEQQEYNSIVSALSELLPDVNMKIDETTGRLETTTSELREGAEAWKEYAKQQAFADIIAEQQAAMLDLQVTLEKSKLELAEYNETATEGSKRYVEALQAETEARKAYAEAMEESNYTETEAVIAAREKVDEAVKKSGEIFAELTAEEQNAGYEMSELMTAIEECEAQIETQGEALEKTKAAMEEYETSLSPAAEKTKEMSENISDASDTLSTMGDGASESVEAIPEAVSSSMAETKGIVDSAIPAITESFTNIGTQGATGLQTGLDSAAESVNTSMVEINAAVTANAQAANLAGQTVGTNIAAGVAAGINAGAGAVAEAASAMVSNAIAAANSAAQINSPSKLMIKTGHGLDEGLIVGIEDMEKDVLRTMKATMNKVTEVNVEAPDIPDNSAAVIRAIDNSGTKGLAEAIRAIRKGKGALPKVEVTQNIYAEDTSYSGQQKAAKKELKRLARELGV